MSIADAIMTRIATTDFESDPTYSLEAERTQQFVQAVHTPWTSRAKYKDEQFDAHPYRPLIHVHSHQLTKAGKLKDKDEPNHRAYPCYLATHANHFGVRFLPWRWNVQGFCFGAFAEGSTTSMNGETKSLEVRDDELRCSNGIFSVQ